MMGGGPSERGQCCGYAFNCIGCPLDFAPRTIQFIEYHPDILYWIQSTNVHTSKTSRVVVNAILALERAPKRG